MVQIDESDCRALLLLADLVTHWLLHLAGLVYCVLVDHIRTEFDKYR